MESPITDWLKEAYEFSEVDSRRFAGIVARKQAAAEKAPVGSAPKRAGTKKKRAAAVKKKAARKVAKKR